VVNETAVTGDEFKSTLVFCPAGKVAVGGGASVFGDLNGVAIHGSEPFDNGQGWQALAQEIVVRGGAEVWALRVRVICANAA
jgi:hypothetical protein